MKVLITGASHGIGKSIALEFINNGHQVIGIDKDSSSITNKLYTHYKKDIFYVRY